MKRWLFAVAGMTLVTLFTVGGVRLWQRYHRVELPEMRADGSALQTARTLREVLDEPMGVTRFAFTSVASPICQEFWRQTVQTRLFAWMSEVDELGWQRPDECIDEEPAILSRLARAVQVACLKRHSERKGPEQQACQEALFNYRLKLADALTGSQKNYLDMPLPLLLAKVIGDQFAEEPGDRVQLASFWAMIDALKSREPDWFPAQKLIVTMLYLRQKVEEDGDLKAQIGERLTKEIDQAITMNNRDPHVLEIELARQLEGDEGSPELETFAVKYPNSALAQYYWASMQCRENNGPDCVSTLEKTASLAPDEPRFRETLDKVRQASNKADPALFDLEPHFDIFNW
jgi:hypothetical protein